MRQPFFRLFSISTSTLSLPEISGESRASRLLGTWDYVVLSIVLSIFIEYYYRRLRVLTGKALAEVGPRSKPNWPWRRQEELVVLSVVEYCPHLKS